MIRPAVRQTGRKMKDIKRLGVIRLTYALGLFHGHGRFAWAWEKVCNGQQPSTARSGGRWRVFLIIYKHYNFGGNPPFSVKFHNITRPGGRVKSPLSLIKSITY